MGSRTYVVMGVYGSEPAGESGWHKPTGTMLMPWGDSVTLHLDETKEYQLRFDAETGQWLMLGRPRRAVK